MSFIVNAVGSLVKGETTAQSYEYNAAIARQNALIAQQQGAAATEAQQRNAARTQGAIIASYGASGVQADSGSPLDVLADSARMAELDKLTTRYNYQLKSMGYNQQAALSDMGASSARTSSYFNAASDFMGGSSDSAGKGRPVPGFGG